MGKRDYYDKSRRSWLSISIIVLIISAIICGTIYYIYSSNDNSKLENNLLKAGKDYYSSGEVLLPVAIGECSTTTIKQLSAGNYVKNKTLFSECDDNETYIKVCKLQNEEYHYSINFQCSNGQKTTFGDWKEGSVSNLIEDKSDVRFSYLAQKYSNQSKRYYPNDSLKESQTKEFYTSAPAEGYTYKENGISASKWYTEEEGKNYWNNGAYSSVQPNGFTTRGEEGNPTTYVSIKKPAEASYRTIKSIVLYRAREISAPYIKDYMCIDARYDNYVISNVPCESRSANNYNITGYINYTCDGENTVKKTSVCSGKLLTDWSTNKCEKSSTIDCETTSGYQYSDKNWQWYTTGTYKKYFPSGKANSTEENTYYVTSPVSGAKKDETTTTTVYKFYKLVDNEDGEEGQWLNLAEDYMNEVDLIEMFNKNGFENVKSLEDIFNEKDIRYSIKLEYRNRK